jgi:hypothetical protein
VLGRSGDDGVHVLSLEQPAEILHRHRAVFRCGFARAIHIHVRDGNEFRFWQL